MTDNPNYLEQAIEAHPQLWARMRQLYPFGLQLPGMVEALAIVGGFCEADIWVKLGE